MYTKQQLEESLKTILSFNSNPLAINEYIKSAGLVSSCKNAAEKCFVYKIKESNDTDTLREAIIDLNESGCFKFKE